MAISKGRNRREEERMSLACDEDEGGFAESNNM
jgi:hypothetical protein